MHDTFIGSDSTITESITDKSVRIGKNCKIGIGRGKKPNKEFPTHVNTGLTIIGKWAEIPNNTLIGRNTIVQSGAKRSDYVGKEIPEGEYVKTTQGWYVNI